MTIITTRRFTLRPLDENDAPRIAELCNDPDIARNTARIRHPYTLENAQDFIAYVKQAAASGAEHTFAVCREGVVIACAGAMSREENACELGYWVGAAYRGMGAATEAGDAVLQFACAVMKPKTLTSGHFVDNPASGVVLSKLGFKATGEIKPMASAGRGQSVETIRMAMAARDYKPLSPVDIAS